MRALWTLFKVVVVLAVTIPLGLMAFGLALGVLGLAVGLAIMVFKLACVVALVYGAFRLAKSFFGWGTPSVSTARPVFAELPARDPYYDAAMRELDAEMGINR